MTQDSGRDRPVEARDSVPSEEDIQELEDTVRRYLRSWEDSDILPSEAAHELVAILLGFDCIHDAIGQVASPLDQLHQLETRSE